LNGDMRLNVQLMGWIFGLFVIGLIGRMILQVSPNNRRNSNGLVALGFAVVVLGYIGLMAGRILQAAVSRQRERLADASGVQFTRNPQGLKGALVKIAALPEGSALVAADAEQAAHMFFAEGLSRVFATHPPILERIRELDPQFDPRELEAAAAQPDQAPTVAEVGGQGGAAGLGAGLGAAAAGAGLGAAGGLGAAWGRSRGRVRGPLRLARLRRALQLPTRRRRILPRKSASLTWRTSFTHRRFGWRCRRPSVSSLSPRAVPRRWSSLFLSATTPRCATNSSRCSPSPPTRRVSLSSNA
jgi:hypothetical protein